MKTPSIIASILLFILAVRTVSGDVVETKTGAKIVGKVTQIDGSAVVVDTDYAGVITIKQSAVTSITTDAPANIRLASGTVLQGTLAAEAGGAGAVTLTGPDGALHTSVDRIVTTWGPGAVDPQIVALQRFWAYEAAVDVVGKTGNSEQLGTGFSFRATLKGPQDKLQFYSAYDRQVSAGEKSADQLKAGVDYQNSFSGRYSWYLRDEAGFDRVKLIDFSNVAAFGLGYDFIKKPKHTLTGRVGLAHRFEAYRVDPEAFDGFILEGKDEDTARKLATKERVSSAGLDLGLNHSLELNNFSIVNRLTFDPSFEDFSDYRLLHESFLELPLQAAMWKVRVGVANDYTSKPSPGKERLDTTYFTRLVLNWK